MGLYCACAHHIQQHSADCGRHHGAAVLCGTNQQQPLKPSSATQRRILQVRDHWTLSSLSACALALIKAVHLLWHRPSSSQESQSRKRSATLARVSCPKLECLHFQFPERQDGPRTSFTRPRQLP